MTFNEFRDKALIQIMECAPDYIQEFHDSETFEDIAELFTYIELWDEDDVEEYRNEIEN